MRSTEEVRRSCESKRCVLTIAYIEESSALLAHLGEASLVICGR